MSVSAKNHTLRWFKENDPYVYKIALERYKLKNQGLGDTKPASTSGFFQSLVETVQKVVPAYIGYRQQNKIMNIQVERAKQGLPPLDAREYSPVIAVEAALSPEGEQSAHRIAMDSVREGVRQIQPILLGALALGAFVLLGRRRGRR